jgi:hypothetical protein
MLIKAKVAKHSSHYQSYYYRKLSTHKNLDKLLTLYNTIWRHMPYYRDTVIESFLIEFIAEGQMPKGVTTRVRAI